MIGIPCPIYDSLARKALQLGAGVGYASFHNAWIESFEPKRARYEAAAAQHSSLATVDAGCPSAVWLSVRAHDQCLMHRGL